MVAPLLAYPHDVYAWGGIEEEDDLVNEHNCFITVVDGTELNPVYAVLAVKEFSN